MVIHGKKGDGSTDLYYRLAEVVLAAIFAGICLVVFSGVLSGSHYHKDYHAKDMALILDTMHAAQGNFRIDYDIAELPNYSGPFTLFIDEKTHLEFVVKDRVVEAYDFSDTPFDQRIPTWFPYATNSKIEVQNIVMAPRKVQFVKNGSNISFNVTGVDDG